MRTLIDSLESRCLFAAGGPAVTDFKISPRNPTATTGALVFTVTYRDAQGVNALTFDGRDLRVAGPNGYARYAGVFGSTSNGDGTVRTVRYKIPAPGGRWNTADNGTYTVRLQGFQVFDILNIPSDGQVLGKFGVNIASDVTGGASVPRAMKLAPSNNTNARLVDELLP